MKKRSIYAALFGIIALSSCHQTTQQTDMQTNPFLQPYGTPYEVPAFDKITDAHFLPAIQEGIHQERAEIDAISKNPEPATFENTLAALDQCGILLRNVSSVFYNKISANTNDTLQNIAKTVSSLLSAHSDDIMLNKALFERIKAVYDQREGLTLSTEQKTLLDHQYKTFVRNGANLKPEEQDSLRKINESLSALSLQFGDNQLAEDNNWTLTLNEEAELDGLPEGLRASAAEAAKEAGKEGKWLISLHKPSWIPFLQYATRRDLREKVYTAWMNRANNPDKFNNNPILLQIVTLRKQKAQLLGFGSWADYVLNNTMAKTPTTVNNMLAELWAKALPMAKAEAAEMQKMIDSEGGKFKLASWDWWFYAEKIRKAKYDLDEEALRPYFELNNVRDGVFYVAQKLYGIQIKPRTDLPKPHPDAQAFEVSEANGTHIGILYMDFYPRAGKQGGAWMSEFRQQWVHGSDSISPIITTVFNFTKPTPGKPALLTFDEVSTTFHEFGHALHGLFSQCHYYTLSSTNVARDFVELPSQVMENWASEPEVLRVFAKHYQTGEPMPDALIEKIQASSKFNQGFATVEYLAASILDMQWHTLTTEIPTDAPAFEAKAMTQFGLIQSIIPRYKSTYFSHIFSGGYSAGYYSYIWAEVLDADAFAAFKESGNIFDPARAKSFRENILQKGGTEDPMLLYTRFRGHEPSNEALLRRRGLVK
ncbi:MAG: hypothetical protein RIS47_1661 [Bacteroidota bacterium]